MAENNGPVKLPDSLVLMRQWMIAEGREIFAAWLEGRVDPEVRQAALGQAKHPDLPRSARGGRVAKLFNSNATAWAASLMLAMCTFAYVAWDRSRDATLAKAQAQEAEELRGRMEQMGVGLIKRIGVDAGDKKWLPMVQRITIAKSLIEADPEGYSEDLRATLDDTIADAWLAMMRDIYGDAANLNQLHHVLKELESNDH